MADAFDIGDWVTPALAISTGADGSTAASLSITAPNGTVTAGTGEAGTGGNASWTADKVQLTAAGVWLFTWTVTGGGAGVEVAYAIVRPAAVPGPAPDPDALATITDLVAILGRPLTAAEAARAPGLLSSASVKIRGYCRRVFTAVDGDEVALRPVGNRLRLPNRPVHAVVQVEQIGTGGTPDRVMSASEWAFDGIDRITLWPTPVAITGAPPTGSYANTYRVTYDHGGATPFVSDMARDVTLRTLMSPTQVEGLVSERIGAYFYQFGQASGDQSVGVSTKLTEADERALRKAGYRTAAGTIQSRAA